VNTPGPILPATIERPSAVVVVRDSAIDPGSVVLEARHRRAEIAAALYGIRRRNRIAAVGLGMSLLLACGSLGVLWFLRANESEDAYVTFRSPIVVKFEPKKSVTGSGTLGNGSLANGPSGNGGPANSGSPQKPADAPADGITK
jgi:hypothetical protein